MADSILETFRNVISDDDEFDILRQIEEGKDFEEIIEKEIGVE